MLSENRAATPEEKKTLCKYVGWGGLKGVFEPWNPELGRRFHEDVKKLLSGEEYLAASRSTQYAHYTSALVVEAMWRMARRLGFSGGRVLEPAMGVGNFFGLMPADLVGKSELIGVEVDPLAGGMAKLLYPDAQIAVKRYQEVMFPDSSLELAIGNVPFSQTRVSDKHYENARLSLHNYFLVRTLDKLKPGAGMVMISSRYSLDSQLNVTARRMMEDRADLVAAFRLPDSAFIKNAGTEVVTDILVFRKRGQDEERKSEPFENVTQIAPGITVNEYFKKHPEHVFGRQALEGRMYGSERTYTVKLAEDALPKRLDEAIESLPEQIFDVRSRRLQTRGPALPASWSLDNVAPATVKEGAFTFHQGTMKRRVNGVLEDVPEELRKPALLSRLRDVVELRNQMKKVLHLQLETSDDEIVNPEREKLNRLYDYYIMRHGFVNGPRTAAVFYEDPEYPLILSLENYDPKNKTGTKAAFFVRRTASPYEPLSKENFPSDPKAGLSRILAATGTVDLKLMAELSGASQGDIIAALEKDDLIYQDPVSGNYVTTDQYLSGDVRHKLRDAKAAAELNRGYGRNVEALEKAQPERLTIHEIEPKLGQTWVPNEAYGDFIRDLATSKTGEVRISRLPGTGEWIVTLDSAFNQVELENKWSAAGWNGRDLIQASLNQKMATVYKLNDNGDPVFDGEGTMAAREMQQKIKHQFRDWCRSHETWGPKLEDLYNDTLNNIRLREYDGSHLEFPGMNPEIELYPHQRNFAWRVIQDGRALAAHVVGAGKTFESIAAAMEMRRMGLSPKNMFVVPNNMLAQWRNDWQLLYPGANVLAVTDNDFTSKNRQRLLGRVAVGDYDGIILTHSAFDLLSVSVEREVRGIESELEDAREVLMDLMMDDRQNRRSIKTLEKSIERMEERLKDLASGKKDGAIGFDELGVTQLFVDEAHNYKNLVYFTRMGQVSGLANSPSQRASRMKLKGDYMLERYKDRGLTFMTGTPITNTLGEIYNMTRYLAPDLLEKAGIRNFDDWAANFGNVVTAYEYSPDGVTLKPRNKFAEFTNVPELQTMFNAFADVKTRQDLPELAVPKANYHNVMVEITDIQNPLLELIVQRGEALAGPMSERPDPKEDNWLKLSSDARKISLDPRLYDSGYPDGEYKAAAAARKVHGVWESTQEGRGTQLIFSDFFANHRDNVIAFDLFQDIKKKLILLGLPESEIAIIQDFDSKDAKESVYHKMRQGTIRVLMGSTEKMGVGVNVQKRLKGLHHLDQPWRPSDVEQREGRIIRQGNEWAEVEIYRYISEPQKRKVLRFDPKQGREIEGEPPKAFDLQMFQKLETKQRFINQIMSNTFKGRSVEDPGGAVVLDYATMKAVATGNPDAMRKVQLSHELTKLEILHRQFDSEQSRRRYNLRHIQQSVLPLLEQRLVDLQPLAGAWKQTESGERFSAIIDGRTFVERKVAGEYLDETKRYRVGEGYKFYGIDIPVRENGQLMFAIEYYLGGKWYEMPPTPTGILSSVESKLRKAEMDIQNCMLNIQQQRDAIIQIQTSVNQGSPYVEKLRETQKELEAVNVRLGLTPDGRSRDGQQEVGDAVGVAPEGEILAGASSHEQLLEAQTPDESLEAILESIKGMQREDLAPEPDLISADVRDGIYRGAVVTVTPNHYVQRITAKNLVLHRRAALQDSLLQCGKHYAVCYKGGSSVVTRIPDPAKLKKER